MSKLTKALIPGYGANPTKPNSNPLSGLAPDLETGLPQGLPSGVGKAALRFSNPVGGIAPNVNGDIGYQKGWLDQSSNGTPAAAPKGPGYNVWADPDMTKRGWGWGMGADGALHQGVQGSGPAGTPWGVPGSTAGGLNGYGPNLPSGGSAAPAAGAATPGGGAGGPPPSMSAATPQGMPALGPGGQQLAAQLRQGQTGTPGQGQGMPQWMQGQGGPAMGPGGLQSGAAMGGQPGAPGGGFPPAFGQGAMGGQQPQGAAPPWMPSRQGMQGGMGPQRGIGTLINQLRQQAPLIAR